MGRELSGMPSDNQVARSPLGLLPRIAAMMPFLIWRLFDEERFLATNLPGYTEYQQRVRHRLVPFVW
jgi:protein-S-isoprenylcysteine O-methyltransferase Ste14